MRDLIILISLSSGATVLWIGVSAIQLAALKGTLEKAWAMVDALWDVRRKFALQYTIAAAGAVSSEALERVVVEAEKIDGCEDRAGRTAAENRLREATLEAFQVAEQGGAIVGELGDKLRLDFEEADRRAAYALAAYFDVAKAFDGSRGRIPGRFAAAVLGWPRARRMASKTQAKADPAALAD